MQAIEATPFALITRLGVETATRSDSEGVSRHDASDGSEWISPRLQGTTPTPISSKALRACFHTHRHRPGWRLDLFVAIVIFLNQNGDRAG